MRRGHFCVSVELTLSADWPLIEAELNKVFTLEAKETKSNGIIEFHGLSPLFEESVECSSPGYQAIFKTVDRKPIFLKFEPNEVFQYKPKKETR